jgi:DNA-binding MarR family transcriptional regulator
MESRLNEIAISCSFAQISRAARTMTQIFDDALKPVGLSAGQFTLLVTLAVAPETTMTPLARRMKMDRTTLARNLQPLERDGLVKISAGRDQRQRVIQLTGAGRQTLEFAVPLWKTAQHTVVELLGFADWQTLMEQLGRINLYTPHE